MRTRLGFNEVEAVLKALRVGSSCLTDLPLVTRGIILRYWNEAYVDPDATAELDRFSRLERPKRYMTSIEDYGIRE